MTFSPDGTSMYVTTFVAAVGPDPASIKLYKIDTSTWTVRHQLDARPHAVRCARPASVEVVGDQIYIGDGGTRTGGRPAAPRDLRLRRERPRACSRRPSFTATPTVGRRSRSPVQFTDTSAGGPTSWAWDFGDGATSTLANPSHTYTAPGTYTVSLHVVELQGQRHLDDDRSRHRHRPGCRSPGSPRRRRPAPARSPSASPTRASNQPATLGVGLRRRCDLDRAEPVAHLHGGRHLRRVADRDQQRRHQHPRALGPGPRGQRARRRSPPRPTRTCARTPASSNFGTQTTIQGSPARQPPRTSRTSASPCRRSPPTPASAKLRLFVTDASTATGTLFATTSPTFPETTTTWNNRPATTGAQIAARKAATLGQWVEFDVTAQVTAAGSYGFTLTNGASDTVAFSSREGANPPQLVFTFPSVGGSTSSLPNPPHVGPAAQPPVHDLAVPGTTTSAGGEGGIGVRPGRQRALAHRRHEGLRDSTPPRTRSGGSCRRPTSPTRCRSAARAHRPGPRAATPSPRSPTTPTTDVLYAFSRNCCTATGLDPSVFRMTRDGAGTFQVESYQSLPAGTDPVAAGVRPGAGLYFGKGQTILPYDYATNTIGTGIVIPGVDTAISGMALHARRQGPARHQPPQRPVPGEHHHVDRGARAGPSTSAAVRLRRPAGVAIVGDQLFVVDGGLRPVGDPLRYAMFVFDIVDGTRCTGRELHRVADRPAPRRSRPRSSTAAPASRPRGSGTSVTARPSTVARPTHTYTTAGIYTVTLTVTNAEGTATHDAAGPRERRGEPAAAQREVQRVADERRRAAPGPVHRRERRRRHRLGVGLR